MERNHSWEKITQTGKSIRQGWQDLAERYDISISHFGLPALTGFNFLSKNALKYKTFISQEMLKRGYLASNSVYVCEEHSNQIVENYLSELSELFSIIKDCEDGKSIDELLKGPICHSGFKRLN